MSRDGTVYLLHFLEPIGNPTNPRAQAQHYLGYSRQPERRISIHTQARGAAIVRHVQQQGIGFLVVRTWPGNWQLERQLKARKKARQLCPACTVQPWERPLAKGGGR
jgi:predicted GIY-YIG superfamily endonuclease